VVREPYVVMTVECPRWKTKEKVHVSTRIGGAHRRPVSPHASSVTFNVAVPAKIIPGRFRCSVATSMLLAQPRKAKYR
jgi:hypothetical protein